MATIQQISEQIKQAGMDVDTQQIANPLQEVMPGGEADNVPDTEFDPEALAQGIKHEMEHTKDEQVAKEIVKDHLKEDKDYYSKLEKMQLSNIDVEIFRLMAAQS